MLKVRLEHSEMKKIMTEYGTPEHIIHHCEAVAYVAVKLASALNLHGYDFDLELIDNAAMLHDIAKISPCHEEVGANYISSRGMKDTAEIIRVHTEHVLPHNVDAMKEVDIVVLADRMVIENNYVGLPARMQYIIDNNIIPGNMLGDIEIHIKNTYDLIEELESTIGMPLDLFFADSNDCI